jgi:hypothetical protein
MPFKVIVEMEGEREWQNMQQNVVFVLRTAVNLSRGGCPEPAQNDWLIVMVKKLDDVCLKSVSQYIAGPGTPSYGATTPSGSDNGQRLHMPHSRESRRDGCDWLWDDKSKRQNRNAYYQTLFY